MFSLFRVASFSETTVFKNFQGGPDIQYATTCIGLFNKKQKQKQKQKKKPYTTLVLYFTCKKKKKKKQFLCILLANKSNFCDLQNDNNVTQCIYIIWKSL